MPQKFMSVKDKQRQKVGGTNQLISIFFGTEKIPVQNSLSAWPGFGNQPRCKAHGEPQVEQVSNSVINIELVKLPP